MRLGLMPSGSRIDCVDTLIELFCIESTDSILVFVVPRSLTIGKKHNEVIVGLIAGCFGCKQVNKYGL